MEQALEAIPESQLDGLALFVIIAGAALAGRDVSVEGRWFLYRSAKQQIDRLNPTADEYERAIKMLTEVLKI